MQPYGDIFPAWMNRLGTFVGITVLAAMCAVAAWWSLLILGVGGGQFFGATIVHVNLVLPITLACGAVVGLAGATGRARDRVLRRSVAASLGLLALALAAIVALFGLWGPSFSAAEFRSAADARNDDTMEFQAHLAVEQGALIGLRPTEVRETLGAPPQVRQRSHQWVWGLGWINDFIGPGDPGALYVTFDSSGSRVIAAKVQ